MSTASSLFRSRSSEAYASSFSLLNLAAEVKDIIVKMEVSKVQLDRLRDENHALKR